jgi:hypothetical protein
MEKLHSVVHLSDQYLKFWYLNCADASPDLKLDLPVQWLWDMVDEFVYQFQFFCQYRAKVKAPEEISVLKSNPDVNTSNLQTKYRLGMLLECFLSYNH